MRPQHQRELLQDWDIPNVPNMVRGEKLCEYPTYKPSKSDLSTLAANTGANFYIPITCGGTTFLVDSEKTQITSNIGNTSLKRCVTSHTHTEKYA